MKWIESNPLSFCLTDDDAQIDSVFNCYVHLTIWDEGASLESNGKSTLIEIDKIAWVLKNPNELYMESLL